jgi:hypothetical protein
VWSAGAGIFYPEMFHLWVATITVMVLEEDCRYGLIIKNKSHSRNWGGVEWNDQFKSALDPKKVLITELVPNSEYKFRKGIYMMAGMDI